MDSATALPADNRAVRPPAYLRLQQVVLALCLLLAPLSLAGWFALCPQYGDPACPNNTQPLAVFVAFRAANPILLRLFLFITLIIPYLYPISYVALGLLAMQRAPWLSTLGIISGWLGSIPWGFISDTMLHLNTAAHLGQDASYATLAAAYFSQPGILAVAAGWVLGHLLGYVLLGSALLRARVIPAWAAWLIILSAPLMGPIAYGSKLGILQVLGFGLVFIGSLPAAWAMLNQPGAAEWSGADAPAPVAIS
jgi:hypothetical protein